MSPEERVRMMERSERCLVYGLTGLVPGIGAGHALTAIHIFFKVRMSAGEEWNPAARHLLFGFVCGTLGSFLSLALFSIVVSAVLGL